MAKIALRIYVQPGSAETFVVLRQKDGNTFRFTAVVDTGAAISLFPIHFLDTIEHQIINNSVEIDQAGIAQQTFNAVEANITGFLEDTTGNRTKDLTFRAWFANTDTALIGFAGVLDQAKLLIDMAETRTGWIELPEATA